MSERRGKRIVVGYVVSHTGKRGGPREGRMGNHGKPTDLIIAEYCAQVVRKAGYPHARALPLVRYEVDAEEERLRDAVVDAADRWESEATPLYLVPSAAKELESAVRALRAHREKVGR